MYTCFPDLCLGHVALTYFHHLAHTCTNPTDSFQSYVWGHRQQQAFEFRSCILPRSFNPLRTFESEDPSTCLMFLLIVQSVLNLIEQWVLSLNLIPLTTTRNQVKWAVTPSSRLLQTPKHLPLALSWCCGLFILRRFWKASKPVRLETLTVLVDYVTDFSVFCFQRLSSPPLRNTWLTWAPKTPKKHHFLSRVKFPTLNSVLDFWWFFFFLEFCCNIFQHSRQRPSSPESFSA